MNGIKMTKLDTFITDKSIIHNILINDIPNRITIEDNYDKNILLSFSKEEFYEFVDKLVMIKNKLKEQNE
jgi:hypothetical protein